MARKTKPEPLVSEPLPISEETAQKIEGSGKKRKAEAVAKVSKRVKKTVTVTDGTDNNEDPRSPPKHTSRATKVKAEEEVQIDGIVKEPGEAGTGTTEVKTKRKRQAKKKEVDITPLDVRTVGSKLLVGAHVSVAGGKFNDYNVGDLFS
jgi:AP endonuclease 1